MFRIGDLVRVKEFNGEIALIVDYDKITRHYLVLFVAESYHNLKQWEPEEQLTIHIMVGEIIKE